MSPVICSPQLGQYIGFVDSGVENIRWILPVHPGDTLRVRLTVLEARVLQSKPHIGLVRNKWEMFNQKDEQVMHMEGYGMFLRRDAPG